MTSSFAVAKRPRDASLSLNILLSHSRSLKVIQNDIVCCVQCKALLVFHWNCVCISYRFWDIQRQRLWCDRVTVWPWNRGLKDGTVRLIIIYDFLLVSHCKYSCTLYRFLVIWRWIISWPWNLGYMSFKIIQTGTIWKLRFGFLFDFDTEFRCKSNQPISSKLGVMIGSTNYTNWLTFGHDPVADTGSGSRVQNTGF